MVRAQRIFRFDEITDLTKYETVARLVANLYNGKPVRSRMIADLLDMSVETVKTHLGHAKKAGLVKAIGRYRGCGWIPANVDWTGPRTAAERTAATVRSLFTGHGLKVATIAKEMRLSNRRAGDRLKRARCAGLIRRVGNAGKALWFPVDGECR